MAMIDLKCVCLWVTEHKKTKNLLSTLGGLTDEIVKSRKDNNEFVFLLDVDTWHKVEHLVDSAGSHAQVQALFHHNKIDDFLTSAERVTILKNSALLTMSDKAKCSKIDEYNAVKRAIEFDKPKRVDE